MDLVDDAYKQKANEMTPPMSHFTNINNRNTYVMELAKEMQHIDNSGKTFLVTRSTESLDFIRIKAMSKENAVELVEEGWGDLVDSTEEHPYIKSVQEEQ